MKNVIKKISVVALIALLGACGAEEPKDFSVSLDSVVVKRVSNGEAIVVETEGVNSGNLTYAPK